MTCYNQGSLRSQYNDWLDRTYGPIEVQTDRGRSPQRRRSPTDQVNGFLGPPDGWECGAAGNYIHVLAPDSPWFIFASIVVPGRYGCPDMGYTYSVSRVGTLITSHTRWVRTGPRGCEGPTGAFFMYKPPYEPNDSPPVACLKPLIAFSDQPGTLQERETRVDPWAHMPTDSEREFHLSHLLPAYSRGSIDEHLAITREARKQAGDPLILAADAEYPRSITADALGKPAWKVTQQDIDEYMAKVSDYRRLFQQKQQQDAARKRARENRRQ